LLFVNIDPENLEPGTIVAGYRILGRIGSGAMGVVYRALQLNLDRVVALKVLARELASDEEFVARFFNEARAAAAIAHPNIIQVYDAGAAEGDVYYFAMEFVEGETLLTTIHREGRLRPRVALSIAIDIASALDYGWEKLRLSHGDIKPENIMMTNTGETKLADFGLAKVAGREIGSDGVLLTPLYAPPERIRGERSIDECRADIYSFGATLYHMLVGEPPYPGTDPEMVMQRHLHEALTPACERCPEVPREVSLYLDRLLAKEPQRRPESWKSVLAALRRLRAHCIRPPAARRPSGAAPRTLRPPAGTVAGRGRGGTSKRAVPGVLSTTVIILLLALVGLLLLKVWWRPATPRAEPRQEAREPEAPSAVDAEWLKLKGKLGGVRDPKLALEMLENFAREHQGELPDDFEWYLKRFRQRAGTAFKQRLHERLRAIEQAARQSEQIPEQERKRLVREIEALYRERGLTPRQRERLASLRRNIERAGTTPVAEEAAAQAESERPGLPDAESSADAQERDYFALLAAVASARSVPALLPTWLNGAGAWLKRYEAPSPEREKVLFLQKVLQSALQFVPALVRLREGLVGKQVAQGPGAPAESIRNVDQTRGLQLATRTQHGETARWVAWSAVWEPAMLARIVRTASSASPRSIEAQRPFLAVLLLSRQWSLCKELLKGLQDADGESKMWLQLMDDLRRAPSEANAWLAWREARERFLAGERARPWRLLRKIERSDTSFIRKHRAEIEQLAAACAADLPATKAGELVRKAASVLQVQPNRALELVETVRARFGRLDFPEKDTIDTVCSRALTAMKQTWSHIPDSTCVALFSPFVRSSYVLWRSEYVPGTALVFLDRIENSRAAPWPKDATSLVRGCALIEAGDWGGARREFERSGSGVAAVLPVRLRVDVEFADRILRLRFQEASVSSLAPFADAAAALYKGAAPVEVEALSVEWAILARRFDPKTRPWRSLAQLPGQSAFPHIRRLTLAALAWEAESGRRGEAMSLAESLLEDEELLKARGFNAGVDSALLKAFVGFAKKETSTPLPGAFSADAPMREYWARALVPVLADNVPARSEVCDSLGDAPLLGDPGSTLIGGDAAFQECVLRVACALFRNDLARAGKIVKRTLERCSLPLTQYYPQCTALTAGLEALAGRPGRCRELLSGLKYATVASEAELAWVRSGAAGATPVSLPEQIAPDTRAAFWYAWINWALRRNAGDATGADAWLAWARKQSGTTRAENVLLAACSHLDVRRSQQQKVGESTSAGNTGGVPGVHE